MCLYGVVCLFDLCCCELMYSRCADFLFSISSPEENMHFCTLYYLTCTVPVYLHRLQLAHELRGLHRRLNLRIRRLRRLHRQHGGRLLRGLFERPLDAATVQLLHLRHARGSADLPAETLPLARGGHGGERQRGQCGRGHAELLERWKRCAM